MITLENITNFIKNLENENKLLKEKIIIKDNIIEQHQFEIDNLSKVSIITNLNKQLKDKTSYIEILEKQNGLKNSEENSNYKNKIRILEEENSNYKNKIRILEEENSNYKNKIRILEEENSNFKSKIISLEKNINDLEENINESQFEKVTYKNKDYFIDGENNVYDIIDNKPNVIVGILKNNKIKLN
jgi:chromosome segregation ATPase